jgi:glycosyltransferase involved in cell wall biosynthesis
MNIFISLCMIVKNEEKTLRRCLESVQDLVDEIIIVDTGSTDLTKTISFEFTSLVYDFVWTKDFSAARNEALSKASGKWVLVLDADEYVQEDDKQLLKDHLNSLDSSKPLGFMLPIMNILGVSDLNSSSMLESSGTRLFANLKDIYYSDPIHEQLTYTQGTITYSSYPFIIFHSGYTNETVAEKNKSQRNLEIFENMKKNGSKLTPYNCFTLGNEYDGIQDFKKAIYYYEKAYSRAKSMLWLPHCMDRMVTNYIKLDRLKDALMLIQAGILKWPRYVDYYYYLGLVYYSFDLYDLAKQQFCKCIEISTEAGKYNRQSSIIHLEMALLLPSQKLAEIHTKVLDPKQTVYYLSKVLQSDSSHYSSLLKLIQILSISESNESLISFLEKIYPLNNKKNNLLLFRMMLIAGNRDLAEYYYNKVGSLNNSFGKTEQLHYALLTNDIFKFKTLAQNLSEEQLKDDEICKFLLLAAIIWQEPSYLAGTIVTENNIYYRIAQSVQGILEKQSLLPIIEEDEILIVSLVTELFNLQCYDAFDWIMKSYSTPNLIHQVANYFHSQQKFDLSVDYYSILLEKNQLQAAGYENLARLYIKQGDIEEGIEFLEKAIELNPLQRNLYIYLYVNCSNPIKKAQYKTKFDNQFPQYNGLPFIKNILMN